MATWDSSNANCSLSNGAGYPSRENQNIPGRTTQPTGCQQLTLPFSWRLTTLRTKSADKGSLSFRGRVRIRRAASTACFTLFHTIRPYDTHLRPYDTHLVPGSHFSYGPNQLHTPLYSLRPPNGTAG